MVKKLDAVIVCDEKLVQFPTGNGTLTFCETKSLFAQYPKKKEASQKETVRGRAIVREFSEVIPEDLQVSPSSTSRIRIALVPRRAPVLEHHIDWPHLK
ncbi:hypothetical protein Tco_0085794 [Tanacetum coccineum]